MQKLILLFVYTLFASSFVSIAQTHNKSISSFLKSLDNSDRQALAWASSPLHGDSWKTGNLNSSYALPTSRWATSGAYGLSELLAPGNNLVDGAQAEEMSSLPPLPPSEPGFSSITRLTSFEIGEGDTQDKPQSKVWKYDGKWWCVIAVSDGTKIFRLDGTTWSPVLKLLGFGGNADAWVTGDLVHILIHRNSLVSYLYTVQYDADKGSYNLWSLRPKSANFTFPVGSTTATLTVDGTGRMWVASNSATTVQVWWSDAPYTTWSLPITLATGTNADDICAITKLPGKIGVMWSNQNSKLFGFKVHEDGTDPATWSNDEQPSSQSAIRNVGSGMADDHISMVVASDGTVYAAVKTGYNRTGFPQVGLLVRRPSGTWDNLYPVVMNEGSREGTQPIVILNEEQGKVKVVYTTATNGGDIVYRESATSRIAFGATRPLINGGGTTYNFATSTHQAYNSEVVVLATNVGTSPKQLVGIVAIDDPATMPEVPSQENNLYVYPNPSAGNMTFTFVLTEADDYTLSLYDVKGAKVSVLSKGRSAAGQSNAFNLRNATFSDGLYFVRLETSKGTVLTQRIVIAR